MAAAILAPGVVGRLVRLELCVEASFAGFVREGVVPVKDVKGGSEY